MSRSITPVIFPAAVFVVAVLAVATTLAAPTPKVRVVEARPDPTSAGDKASAAQTLARFDFEGEPGPDPQGWTAHDLSVGDRNAWHVDDFAGLPAPYTPLEGTKSMWCGFRPDPADSILGGYATLPGYGNNWRHTLTSQPFLNDGGAWITFDAVFDLEQDFDRLLVEARTEESGPWVTLPADFTGTGAVADEQVDLPAGMAGEMVRVRFFVSTDIADSDADGGFDGNGAAVIDDIRIFTTNGGQIHAEDFEDEAVGDQATTDGFWTIDAETPFGAFASLAPGLDVLQKDPAYGNDSSLWTFFQGSEDTYRCVDPDQPAVPIRAFSGSTAPHDYFFNEIRSPWTTLLSDENGTPVAGDLTRLRTTFAIYRDFTLDDRIYYAVRWRWRTGGILSPWQQDGFAYTSETTDWIDQSFNVDIPAGAEEVQVAFQARDWSGEFPEDVTCHSHAPLVDDVVMVMQPPTNPDIVVTNTDDSGPGSLRAAIILANATSDPDRIMFDIPGAPSVIRPSSDLPALNTDVTIDGTSDPDYAGTPVVHLDGSLSFGSKPALRLQQGSTLRGLSITGFADHGVELQGRDNTIQGCWIGVDPSESVLGNSGYGVMVISGSSDNTIGGIAPGEGNRIAGHAMRGVVVVGNSSGGNAIRGNAIYQNLIMGIDLAENAITQNDAGDTDNGPNGLQNFPEITLVNGYTGVIEGRLSSRPNQLYAVDLFRSAGCSPADHGEGEEYLVSVLVETDDDGLGVFSAQANPLMTPGRVITATATDSGNNTSEFSRCFVVPDYSAVTSTADAGGGSLRQVIGIANEAGGGFVIAFDLPPLSGPISPTSPLPVLTGEVVLDGFSQPLSMKNTTPAPEGLDTVLGVELDGSLTTGDGLVVRGDYSIVRGLCINDWSGAGVRIQARFVEVAGCFLGTNRAGTAAEGNATGVYVEDTGGLAAVPFLGGEWPAERNLVSGNTGSGLTVVGGNARIYGNLVGTDATGTTAVPNFAGVEINSPTATAAFVGGLQPARRNVIAGNVQFGVLLGSDSGNCSGNYIGTQVDGISPLGNGTHGVLIAGDDNVVGTGGANVIAHNGFDGIRVFAGTGNRFRFNDIHSNGQLGIDIEPDGVTPAPGGYPTAPTIVDVDPAADLVFVEVAGNPGEQVHVEAFLNVACDPSGYGEGRTYLAPSQPILPASGTTTVAISSPVDIIGGEFVTATLERPGLGTSEFSACYEVYNTPAGTDVVVTSELSGGSGTELTLVFDLITAAGNTTASASSTPPEELSGFEAVDPDAFIDITTDAGYAGNIEVCLSYDDALIEADEGEIVLLHYDDTIEPAGWLDITTSLDTANDVVCGVTTGLSPFVVAVPTVVSSIALPKVAHYALLPNVPNPFNPSTDLRFELPRTSAVRLVIYDLAGRAVRTLLDGEVMTAGRYEKTWNGRDDAGRTAAAGVYLYRLEAGGFDQTRRMALVK